MSRHEVATRRVLYEIPGMESVRVRKEAFAGADGQALPLEVYDAIDPIDDCVVAIVAGFPDARFEQHVGCKFMDMAWSISNNPITKDFCPDAPLFVVRSGHDETPGLNQALDAFIVRAIADDKPITLVNHPKAPHSYELSVDAPETRRILQQGLDFLRAHLV